MRKEVMYFILLFILIASSSCVTTSKPVHVIITAGQSNTDGRTSNKDLPDYIKALAKDTAEYSEGAYPYCRIAQNDPNGKFIPSGCAK